jgi:hypothetical protein
MSGRQVLVLVKGQQHYEFSFSQGQEPAVLSAMIELAADRHSEFDWFDLAILQHQMERSGTQEEMTV